MKVFAVLIALFFSCFSVAQCVTPNQNGTLIFTADTAANCSGYWLIPATDYNSYLSAVEITATDLTVAFAWGLGTVVSFGFIGFVTESIRKTLRF